MIPDVATKKLAALVQAAEDARALAFAAKDRVAVLEGKVLQLVNAHAGEVELAEAEEQAERAADLQQQRYRHWQDTETLVTRVTAWLTELPRNVTLETAPAPAVAMNGSPAVVVGGLRTQIANLLAEFHQVKLAPAPLDDAKRQVRELVAMLGTKGKPTIRTQFGELHVHGWQSDEQFGPTFHDMTIATLCWLAPQMVIDKLDEALEALPHNDDALPLSARASRLAEIEAEIALLEIQEEVVIERAAKDGIILERRHDQSPASILGVRIATAVRVAA